MAVFIAHALDLQPNAPPERPFPAPPSVGEGMAQRVWLIDENEHVARQLMGADRPCVSEDGLGPLVGQHW